MKIQSIRVEEMKRFMMALRHLKLKTEEFRKDTAIKQIVRRGERSLPNSTEYPRSKFDA